MSGVGKGVRALLLSTAIVAVAPAAIAVDATGSATASTVATVTASITTVAPNTILLAWITNLAGASASGTSSITATGLTFTKRTTNNITANVSNGIDFELWWAKVTTPGTYSVTAHSAGTYQNGYLGLVSYSNVNQTAPFDPNFTLSGPAGQASNTSLSSSVAMATNLSATSNPGSFLVGGVMGGIGTTVNAGTNGETEDLRITSTNSIQHIANRTGTFNLRAITWNSSQQYWATIADALQPVPVAGTIFIDATAPGAMSTASSVNATITTHVANTLILAWITNLGATAVSSVSGGSLTWTKRKANPDSTSGGTAQNQELWWAFKAAAGSLTVTATWGSSQSNAKINLVAYANVNLASPFDTNGSLPTSHNLNNGTAGNMTTASASTSANGSMLVGGFNVAGGNAYYPGTAGEVFDVSDQSNNSPVEHLATTSTFSSKAITFAYSSPSGGTATNWVSIVDALALASGGNDANTLLLLHCDGTNGSTTFADSSSNGVTVTANGTAAVSTTASEFGGAAYKGDGSAGCKLTTNLTTNPGSGDFTFEFWINASSTSGNHYLQAKQHDTGSPAFGPFSILLQGTSIVWYVSSNGTSWDISGGNTGGTIATGAWHHFALVRHGSTFTAYLDGVANATTATSSAALYASSDAFSIGGPPDSGTSVSCFNGYLDEIRYSNVARWTANFTPPATPYS